MKARGAALQGALAVGGLIAAYAAWQRPEQTPGETVALDLSRGELSSIRYEDGPRWVELTRGTGDGEATVWMRTGTRDLPATDGGVRVGPDGGLAAVLPSPPKQPKVPEREIRANDAADKLFEKFEPLMASRALGALDADKLTELGLSSTEKRLELTGRKGKYAFKVATSLGTNMPYLQSDQDHRVYLIGSNVVSELDAAQIRLADRRLHSFKPSEFDSMTVTVDDKRRELVYAAKESSPMAKVASKKTPDKPDDFARNWHQKVWALIPTEMLGRAESPPGGEPKVAARVDYFSHGKGIGWIDVAEVKGATAAPPEIYVRTEHTQAWVKVHSSGEDLLKEAKKVASES